MSRAIALVFLAAFRMASGLGCAAWELLPVKVFDESSAGANVLETAKKEAAWLLKSVCVEVIWIPCDVVTTAKPVPCSAPPRALELHILEKPLSAEVPPNVMGTAVLLTGYSARAGVYFSHVRQTVNADPGIIGVPGLLGHVMAHEIGHLLLGSVIHSEGIMQATFRRAELKKAAQRRLGFSPQQRSAIQKHWQEVVR
jgi:hypothetical protein